MATEIVLPKLGLTMTEGTITEMLVDDGAKIAVGDAIMTVATDKVDVDIEAESEGLFHAAIEPGVTLPPGALLGWLLEPGESVPEPHSNGSSTISTVTTGGDAATAVPTGDDTIAPETGAPVAPAPSGRLLASPNAKRVARELGIDLSLLRGTGPGGRIVSEDVEEAPAPTAAEAGQAVPPPGPAVTTLGALDLRPPLRKLARRLGVDASLIVPTGVNGAATRSDVLAAASRPGAPAGAAAGTEANPVTKVIPLTGMRGAIASRMTSSLQESAQLTHGYHVCVDAVVAVRAQLKAGSQDGAVVPSINDFVVKAAALALREHPGMNATIVDNEIRLLEDIHVGLAVAVPNGLFVPVIRHADELSMVEIAEETRELAGAARAGKLALDQLEGGTFAVTSLGTYGVDFFTPVINPGNVGILGVGQMRAGVTWDEDRPVRTQELTLSLTFDHRAVDGAPAAEFLRTMDDLLSRPLWLLAG